MLRKTNTDPPRHKVIGPEQVPAVETPAAKSPAAKSPAEKRPAAESKEGPERKRTKISWP